jgi:hypothetical protein
LTVTAIFLIGVSEAAWKRQPWRQLEYNGTWQTFSIGITKRADPDLRRAVAAWAETVEICEATTAPRRRPPFDVLYDRVRAFLERTMSPSVFL